MPCDWTGWYCLPVQHAEAAGNRVMSKDMTLRDWFAGQALNQAVEDYDRMGKTPYTKGDRLLAYETKATGTRQEIIARQAYRYADAMLAARAAAKTEEPSE